MLRAKATLRIATKRLITPKNFLSKRPKSISRGVGGRTPIRAPMKRRTSMIARVHLSTVVGLSSTRQSARLKLMIRFKIHHSSIDIGQSHPSNLIKQTQSLRLEHRKTSQRSKFFKTNFYKTSYRQHITKSGLYCAQIAAQ